MRLAVTSDIVRPLTDAVTVQSASITSFAITAELTLFPGPDPTLALDTARQAVTDMARPLPDDLRRLLEQQ